MFFFWKLSVSVTSSDPPCLKRYTVPTRTLNMFLISKTNYYDFSTKVIQLNTLINDNIFQIIDQINNSRVQF